MSGATLIPVELSLATTYRPDCDYIDGEVWERNSGENGHARLQTEIAMWFTSRKREWNIITVVEQRVQVAQSVTASPMAPCSAAISRWSRLSACPPIVCCEVISRFDTMREVRDRCNDYLNFGVEHVWVFDPLSREAFVCTANGFHTAQAEQLTVPATPIYLPLPQIFAELD